MNNEKIDSPTYKALCRCVQEKWPKMDDAQKLLFLEQFKGKSLPLVLKQEVDGNLLLLSMTEESVMKVVDMVKETSPNELYEILFLKGTNGKRVALQLSNKSILKCHKYLREIECEAQKNLCTVEQLQHLTRETIFK